MAKDLKDYDDRRARIDKRRGEVIHFISFILIAFPPVLVATPASAWISECTVLIFALRISTAELAAAELKLKQETDEYNAILATSRDPALKEDAELLREVKELKDNATAAKKVAEL